MSSSESIRRDGRGSVATPVVRAKSNNFGEQFRIQSFRFSSRPFSTATLWLYREVEPQSQGSVAVF
jgi:hypothetical protein